MSKLGQRTVKISNVLNQMYFEDFLYGEISTYFINHTIDRHHRYVHLILVKQLQLLKQVNRAWKDELDQTLLNLIDVDCIDLFI